MNLGINVQRQKRGIVGPLASHCLSLIISSPEAQTLKRLSHTSERAAFRARRGYAPAPSIYKVALSDREFSSGNQIRDGGVALGPANGPYSWLMPWGMKSDFCSRVEQQVADSSRAC